MKEKRMTMSRVLVLWAIVALISVNWAAATGIGFGVDGSNTYLIQNTGVTLLSNSYTFNQMFGAGNGVAYGLAGNTICYIDSTGVQSIGDSWGGVNQFAGAGNGVAYAMKGNVIYRLDSSGSQAVPTTWSSSARLIGSGNGTAYVLEGDGSLWKLSGTGYSPNYSNWAGTTTFFSAGNEEAFLKQGSIVYQAYIPAYRTVGGFNDATQYAAAGGGTAYAVENNKLYRLPAGAGGYQSLVGTWDPDWMVGLGNGGLYLIQDGNLFYVGAADTQAAQFAYSSWNPTLFEGLGDGDAAYLQGGSLYYLTGTAYSSIGSGSYQFNYIVGAMDIDSGVVVPEPATLGLLAIGGLGLFFRKKS